MNNRMCGLISALSLVANVLGGEVASSARSSSFAVDTEIVTNSTLTVDGSMLPFRLDYSPSFWWDETGGGGTARIAANDRVILEATHDGTFLWNPSIAGVYSIKCISANNVTFEKRFNVVAPTVTIEREGYNLCKLTASDGVSEIRYTMDGTAPTADSPLYTEPFEVPPSRLSFVRAATFADRCPQGEVASARFNPVASFVSVARANCAIDNSGETKMVGYDAIPLPYETAWEGDSSSSMELRVDGNLIATRTGAGDVAWTPEHDGVNLLTLRTINATRQTLAEYSAQYDVVPRTVIISNGDVAPLRERYPGLCHWITNITIEAGVTDIGASAFAECSGLTSITIPDSVTSIGDSAFRGCSGLTSLTIPDSVTNLGMRVAFNPGNWTRVEADAEGCTSAYRPDVASSSVSSEMSLTVEGPLDWSFKWKTPVEGYDSMKLRIEYGYGGITGAEMGGTGGSWEEFQCQMTEGKNTISWTYIKRWYGAGSGDDCGCVAFDLPANAFSIFEGCTGLTSVTMPERFKPLFGDTLNGCPITYYGFRFGKVCGGGWFVKHEIWENNEVGLYGDEYAFVPVTGSGFIKPIILYGDTPTAHLGRVSVWTDEQMFEKFVPSGVSPSKWEDHYDEWEHETSGAWYSWAKGIWPDNKIVDGRRWIVVPANEVCLWSGVTSFRVGIAGTREISDPILVVPSEEFEQNGLFAKLTPNDFIHGVTISGYENFEAWDEAEINWGEDWYQSSFASRMQTFEIENWRAVSAGRSMTFNVGVPSAGTLVVSSTDDDGDSPAMRDVFSITGSGIVSDTAIVKSNDYDSPDYCRNVTNFWKTSSASHIRRIEVNKATTLTFTSNTDEDDCEFNRMYFFPKSGKSVAIDVGYIVHEDTDVFRYWGRDYVQGYVTGGGVYKSGESATLKAVSGEGQEFDRWEVRFGNLTLTEAQKRNPTLSFTVTDAMCGSMEDEEQIFISAIWKPKYKVTVLPSIVGAGTVMGTGRYFEGETVTLSATAAEGCTFVKWSDGETAATRQIKVVAADVERVIYACFEAPNGVPGQDAYAVFFDGNGGDVSESVRMVEKGKAVGTLPTATREKYKFLGWFTAASVGTQVTASTVVTSDVTYYAHWTGNGEQEPEPESEKQPISTHEPSDVPELYAAVEGAAPASAASEYNGYLYDAGGVVKGTIQVKVGKPGKDGKASVKATAQVGASKATLKAAGNGKATIAENGPTTIQLVGGEACTVVLGAEGLSGSYGAYTIDGSRNFFSSKDKSEQGAANDLLTKWLGAVNVVWDGGNASVSIAKKGKAKVSLTLANGTKATANAQLLVGEKLLCVPVVVTKKANLAFALWLPLGDGQVIVDGLGDGAIAGKPGSLGAGAKFRLDAAEFAAVFGQAVLPYLPDGIAVTQSGAKWALPKAGKVAYKDGAVDETKLGENPSGLKLTYKAKDGSFKGSFKVYAVDGGKAKATTVNVTGVMVNGVGYGTATIKGKGSVAVSIE